MDYDLVQAAIAAYDALKSYQYGNASPDLAEEVSESLFKALQAAGYGDRVITRRG
jgi:hypothetical protein